jgi:hypothetical protein
MATPATAPPLKLLPPFEDDDSTADGFDATNVVAGPESGSPFPGGAAPRFDGIGAVVTDVTNATCPALVDLGLTSFSSVGIAVVGTVRWLQLGPEHTTSFWLGSSLFLKPSCGRIVDVVVVILDDLWQTSKSDQKR